MTHGHVNGKCLDRFEEIGCTSPFRINTGKPASFEDLHPDYGVVYMGPHIHGNDVPCPVPGCWVVEEKAIAVVANKWASEKNTLDIRSNAHDAHIRKIGGADTAKVYDGGEQYVEVEDIGDLYNAVGEPEVLETGRDKLSRANNVVVLDQLNDALANGAKMPSGVTGDRPLGQITEHHEKIVPPPPSFEELLARRFEVCESLLIRKHRDYGPKNISNSPGGALNGLRVRMHDKLARINNLYSQIYDETSYNDIVTENESFRDSFVDLVNYGVIALMVLDGVWPEE